MINYKVDFDPFFLEKVYLKAKKKFLSGFYQAKFDRKKFLNKINFFEFSASLLIAITQPKLKNSCSTASRVNQRSGPSKEVPAGGQ